MKRVETTLTLTLFFTLLSAVRANRFWPVKICIPPNEE
jgi:hypothetical protein